MFGGGLDKSCRRGQKRIFFECYGFYKYQDWNACTPAFEILCQILSMAVYEHYEPFYFYDYLPVSCHSLRSAYKQNGTRFLWCRGVDNRHTNGAAYLRSHVITFRCLPDVGRESSIVGNGQMLFSRV